MESKTNYTLVGLLVLILAIGLLCSILWLSVGFNQKVYNPYTVFINESVAGLTKDAPVKFNGVQIGFVKEIKLNANDPRQVELTLHIEKGIPITMSTTATLISQGITGVTYIGLSASSPNLKPLHKMPDEIYPVIPATPSLFNQLDTILKEVSENINKVSTGSQLVFNDENALHIKKSLANLDQFLVNISQSSKEFPQVIKELKKGIIKFNSLANDISLAGKNVSKTMVVGKHAFNKISQEAVPSAVSLLHHLNTISANIEQVSNELRQNPAIIIRGTTGPKPGPGE